MKNFVTDHKKLLFPEGFIQKSETRNNNMPMSYRSWCSDKVMKSTTYEVISITDTFGESG